MNKIRSVYNELEKETSNSEKDSKIIGDNIDDDLDDELSELTDDDNKENNKENNKNDDEISNEFKEKVITYLKCDDLIRKKMEEIKELKEKRKPCEEYIIKYLETKDSSFVIVKDGKLIKNKTESKGSLKMDIIKEAIMEGIKGEDIPNDNEVKSNDIAAKIINIMDNKRAKTVNVKLKRTFQRKDKQNKRSKKQEN